jgi:hypothetical protein
LGFSKKENGLLLANNITWNKFKLKKLSSPIQDNSCDVGEFSHLYIIMCEYFCL